MIRDIHRGIAVRNTKIAYFLDPGKLYFTPSLQQLRNTLSQRGVISIKDDKKGIGVLNFEILTLKEAKERGYEIVAIHMSEHIAKIAETTQD